MAAVLKRKKKEEEEEEWTIGWRQWGTIQLWRRRKKRRWGRGEAGEGEGEGGEGEWEKPHVILKTQCASNQCCFDYTPVFFPKTHGSLSGLSRCQQLQHALQRTATHCNALQTYYCSQMSIVPLSHCVVSSWLGCSNCYANAADFNSHSSIFRLSNVFQMLSSFTLTLQAAFQTPLS